MFVRKIIQLEQVLQKKIQWDLERPIIIKIIIIKDLNL